MGGASGTKKTFSRDVLFGRGRRGGRRAGGNGVVGDIWQFENDISRWKWKNIADGDFARILPLFVITC